MMINIKNKKFWFTTVAVLAAPAILNFTIFQFTTPWTYGDGDEWLSFWGSYSGGLISAYVAYFIANSQIKKQVKIDQYTNYVSQLPALMRIQMELKRYLTDIKEVQKKRSYNVTKFSSSGEFNRIEDEETLEALVQAEADSKRYEIRTFDPNLFNVLEKIEDTELHLKLISCFQFYEDFSSIIVTDIEILEERKTKVIDKLILKGKSLDMCYVNDEVERIDSEMLHLLSKRDDVWKTFDDENMLDKFEIVLLEVMNEIENIKRAKDTPSQA